jgi:hypothetical protein
VGVKRATRDDEKRCIEANSGKPLEVIEVNHQPARLVMIKEAIFDLWKGNFSLPVAYWGWGVLGNIIIGGLLRLVEDALEANPNSLFPAFSALIIGVTAIIYSILVFVGAWRSANRYRGWRGWLRLAKASVILGSIRGLVELAKIFLIRQDDFQ